MSDSSAKYPAIHGDDLPWEAGERGELFAFRRKRLSQAAGGAALRCDLMELPPGKTAEAFRFKLGNEDAIYVLAGNGTLRLPSAQIPIRAGSYIALPAGAEHAHQIINTGSEPLRYLLLGTTQRPDVRVYPDSETVEILHEDDDDGEGSTQAFALDAEVDRWERETTTLGDGEPAPRDPADRKDTIEQMVEEDLDALRKKLGDKAPEPATKTSEPEAEAEAKSTKADEPKPEVDPVEAELEALRRKIKNESGATPPRSPSTEPRSAPSGRDVDDIEALKRSLDGDD